MQTMRHLKSNAYTSMPWKNGGGVTTEIIVHPAGATMTDFDWRISMADVAQDGPFSIFPEIERTLSILEGNGMSLSIDGKDPVALTVESAPLPFAADVPVDATLTDGPIVDLNVMSRRGHFRHRVEKHRGELRLQPAFSTTTFIFAVDQAAVSSGSETIDLERRDGLLIEPGAAIAVRSADQSGQFFIVTFDRG